MALYEQALARLQRQIPGGAPSGGWGRLRQKAAAHVLGISAPAQLDLAMAQMHLGARMRRTDAGGWASDEYTWKWTIEPTDVKAGGVYLDLWGSTLGVPRFEGEADSAYAPRILTELTRPTTTNRGLEQVLDDALGVTGTQVVDGIHYMTKFNSGKRFCGNQTGLRVFGLPKPNHLASIGCCFMVLVPAGANGTGTPEEIERIVQRRKAGGTRLLAVAYATSEA